jgi:membrane protease YdiL (CAAX protease family)
MTNSEVQQLPPPERRSSGQPVDRWRVMRSVPVRLLVFFVTLAAVDILCQMALRLLRGVSSAPWGGVLAVVCAVGAGAVMIAAYRLLVRSIEQRTAQELGRRHAARLALSGVVGGAALFTAVEMVLAWKGVAHFGPYAGTAYLGHAIAVSLVAAVGEEIVFRGVVFRIVEEGFGTLVALVFSAGLFGVLHGFNHGASTVSTVAIALEAGILLAAAYTATRSLWLPIGLHFGWNFTEGGVFGAAVSGNAAHGLVSSTLSGDALWTGGAFGPEASVAAVGVCLAASLVLLAITIGRRYWQPLRFEMRLRRLASNP